MKNIVLMCSLLFVCFIATTDNSYAQTDTSKTKADIKVYMPVGTRNVDTSFHFVNGDTSAVDCDMPLPKSFNTWEAGIHFGVMYPNTDIAASDVNAHNFKGQWGVDARVTKYFSHTFGLRAQFLTGRLQGENLFGTYGYKTDVNYDITLNAVLQTGQISFLKIPTNLSFFLTAGVGFGNYNPVNDSAGIKVPYNYLTTANGNRFRVDYSNTTEIVVPFGVGARYLFAKNFSVDAEYSLRVTRSDRIDGWYRELSEDDNYTYVNVGITWFIGKKSKHIEWVNPVADMYTHMCNMQTKLNELAVKLEIMNQQLKADVDSDGVPDFHDKDNATPKGLKVYGDGTAVDFDRDSVPDAFDDCPITPGLVKFKGCPDRDNDGVPDNMDTCPTEPGPVENHGCPVAAKLETKQQSNVEKVELSKDELKIIAEVYKNLEFETGKTVIRASSYPSLNKLADLLVSRPAYRLLIEGHTDNVGGADFNMKLSQGRADAVKKYLVSKGVNASQVVTQGYGMTKPIAPNSTPAGRQKNRRVEFTIIK